jgi:thioesterase domain-containing protein
MLPSQFIFHTRLPLTPYGKVDRTALVASHPAPPPPQAVEETDGLETALSHLWHALLPAAGQSPKDAKFSVLGGDSLLMVRLLLGVEEIIGQRLEASAFLTQPTFSGLCQAVRTRMLRTEFQPVLTLRKHGIRPPLFCIYGCDGDIGWCIDLMDELGDDQPVFGIRSPALDDHSRLPTSIESAAAEVIRSIRKVQPEGIPAVIGYSWGNLLAFEVARQLAKNEGISCFTALIGGDAPMRRTNFSSNLKHFVKYLPPWILEWIRDDKNRWRRMSVWGHRLAREKLSNAHLPLVSSPISHHMIALMEKYSPPPESAVSLDLFRDRDSYQAHPHPLHPWELNKMPDGGWKHWTHGLIRVHWLEGDHHSILRPPAVSSLAQSILLAVDQYLKASFARNGGSPELALRSPVKEAHGACIPAKSEPLTGLISYGCQETVEGGWNTVTR